MDINDRMETVADINEYRRKTIARLVDKRREYQNVKAQNEELERIQETAFRTEWRKSHKEATNHRVIDRVDNYILQKTIKKSPEVIFRLKKNTTGATSDPDGFDPLAGLVIDSDSIKLLSANVKDDSLLLAKKYDITSSSVTGVLSGAAGAESVVTARKAAGRGFTIENSEMTPTAVEFLQNAVTFGLAINRQVKHQRTRDATAASNLQAHVEHAQTAAAAAAPRPRQRTSPSKPRSPAKGGKGKQVSLVQSTGPVVVTAPPAPVQVSFSTYDNASQANDLLWALSHPAQSFSATTTAAQPGRSGDVVGESGEAGVSVRTTGLMARFVPAKKGLDREGLPSRPAQRPARELFSPIQRTHSFISTYLSSAVAATPSAGRLGQLQHTQSVANLLVGECASRSDNDNAYCSLVESVFLLGPSQQVIQQHVAALTQTFAAPGQSNSSKVPFEGRSLHVDTGSGSTTSRRAVVEGSILFMTDCDNPAEMLALLPSYCFPR